MDTAVRARNDGVRPQERDIELLQGLFECRVMEQRHIAEIYFNGSREGTKKRLQALRRVGLIKEQNPNRGPTERAVYCLAHAGFDLLHSAGRLDHYADPTGRQFQWKRLEDRHQVSPFTLAHEIAVMDVKAALHAALRMHKRYKIAKFQTWPALYQFEVSGAQGVADQPRTVKPDGYLHISRQADDRVFSRFQFLEVDRGTETHATLLAKARGYDLYRGSPEFSRFATGSDEAVGVPFRTLFIFGGSTNDDAEERLFNFAHWLAREEPPAVPGAFLLSTHARLLADPLGRIWL